MKRRTLLQTLPAAAALAMNKNRRQELYSLLGELPPRNRKMNVRVVGTENRGTYVLERLVMDVNGIEEAPAYFVKPAGATGKLPTVLYCHAHGGDYKLGKDELLNSRKELDTQPYAEVLTSMGYAALCMDMWVFGERAKMPENDMFKLMIWRGQVLWGMMVYDSLRGVDYLVSRPDVDASRLCALGLSMGSTMAWWVAALDERIKVTVDICCLTDYQALIESKGLSRHGFYYYVPSLLKHFTTAQINALIAPRPHLGLAGEADGLTPVAGLDRIDAELKKVYADAKVPDNWKLLRYPGGHKETPEMRAEVVKWLKAKL